MGFLSDLPGRVYQRVAVELDALAWRRDLAAARAQALPEPTGTLLICDLFAMIATAKVEALLALAAAGYGLRPVVLTQRPDRVLERIYKAALPAVEFRYLDDYLSPNAAEFAAHAGEMMAGAADLPQLVALEWQGFRIGRNALSKFLRQRRQGKLDLADTDTRAGLGVAIAESLGSADAARRVVAELKPTRALFNERGYTPAGEVFDACLLAGCDAVQWFGAPRSDCLMYTRYRLGNRGMHPMALSQATWQKLSVSPWSEPDDAAVLARIASNYKGGGWYNRQKLQDGKAILAAEETRRLLDLPPGRKVAVIFAHILYDATFFYGESVFADYQEWLVETVRHAIANPQITWIVKVHPVNVWRSAMDGKPMEQLEAQALREAFGGLPDHVRLMPADTGVNTASLFDVMDYGLTVRGTIGMELPCLGIPVVTAGTGRYSGLGFTMDPPDRRAYADLLARLHEVPPLDQETMRLARRHYHAALNLRPVPMQSFVLDFTANTYGARALTQNSFVVPAKAGEPWYPGDDLKALAGWIATDSDEDIL